MTGTQGFNGCLANGICHLQAQAWVIVHCFLPTQEVVTRLPIPGFVVIGGVGATVWHPWEQPSSTGFTAAQLEQATDVQVLTKELDGGGAITVTRSPSLNSAYVSTHNMPRLQSGRTYQLWTIHDGVEVPAGLVDGDASKVLVEGDPGSAQGLAITIEKAGGVETPSTDRIVAAFDFPES